MTLPCPVLETARLMLRPLCEADAPSIQAGFSAWDVVRFFSRKRISWPYPDNGALEYLARVLPDVASGKRLLWAICLKDEENAPLAGVIELSPQSAGDQRSFWAAPEWQGMGVMTEAAALVTDFAFYQLNMSELFLVCADENHPSVRLKQASGALPIAQGIGALVGGDLPVTRWVLSQEAWTSNRPVVINRLRPWIENPIS